MTNEQRVMEGFHQPDAKTSPTFEPLTELIEQYAMGKFEAMPVHLRERVAQAFFPMPHWDQLAPDQRRSLAQQNDVQQDPALEPENEYWWQLTCRTHEVAFMRQLPLTLMGDAGRVLITAACC